MRPIVVVGRLLDRTLHVLRAKAVRPRRIRSSAMNCGRCESSSASRPRHSYSPLSGVARSPPRASPSCSPAPAMRPRLASLRSTHTCYRHACGYALANKGIDTRTIGAYLGHRSINRSKRYWRFFRLAWICGPRTLLPWSMPPPSACFVPICRVEKSPRSGSRRSTGMSHDNRCAKCLRDVSERPSPIQSRVRRLETQRSTLMKLQTSFRSLIPDLVHAFARDSGTSPADATESPVAGPWPLR